MKLKTNKNISVYLMLAGYLLIQLANPFDVKSLVSLGTYVIAFATVIAFLGSLFEKHTDIGESFYVIRVIHIVLILCFAAASMIYANSISWPSMVALICFLEIPFFMVSYSKLESKTIKKAIYLTTFVLSVFYIYLSFSPVAYRYVNEFGIENVESLTLGYNNPNETAMYLFTCFVILGVMLKDIDNKIFKGVLLLDFAFCFWLILKTGSRTMSVLAIVVALYTLIYSPKIIKKWHIIVAFATPVLFIIISLLFPNITFMGDALDTDRVSIFARIFENMNVFTFFFGNYNFKFENLHNAYVSVFGTIGLVGFIIYISLLFSGIKNGLLNNNGFGKNAAKFGILMIIISTSAEAAMLTSGSAFAASVISIYLLSVYNNVEVSENENITDKYRLSKRKHGENSARN